jgi:hypothetical protein
VPPEGGPSFHSGHVRETAGMSCPKPGTVAGEVSEFGILSCRKISLKSNSSTLLCHK